jgi:hypothetical protein
MAGKILFISPCSIILQFVFSTDMPMKVLV